LSDHEAFKEYLIEEFVADYQERRVSRRDTLKLLAGVTGSMTIAGALVAACSPAPAPAPTATSAPPTAAPRPANTPVGDDRKVAANDPAVRAEQVRFPSGSDTIMGYLARPSAGTLPT
jgi:carboxymethylenebutenolidase